MFETTRLEISKSDLNGESLDFGPSLYGEIVL